MQYTSFSTHDCACVCTHRYREAACNFLGILCIHLIQRGNLSAKENSLIPDKIDADRIYELIRSGPRKRD